MGILIATEALRNIPATRDDRKKGRPSRTALFVREKLALFYRVGGNAQVLYRIGLAVHFDVAFIQLLDGGHGAQSPSILPIRIDVDRVVAALAGKSTLETS
jgi:hypothetical protein